MTAPPSHPRASDKQARLARVYDQEIVPPYAGRFAGLLLWAIPFAELSPEARVLEIGCATGHLTRELAGRLGEHRRLIAIDESEPFLEAARGHLGGGGSLGAAVTLQLGSPLAVPAEDASVELVVSNLAAAAARDPPAALREIVRVLAPGGQVVLTAPVRGTWDEFLDLFRDVLRETGKQEGLAALEAHLRTLPEAHTLVQSVEEVGLTDVRLDVDRWEILFKSAREFFFSPLVDAGPLPRWKQLSGRGDEMQDVFFFAKEAIDTYFKGRPFAVSVVGAAVTARRPA